MTKTLRSYEKLKKSFTSEVARMAKLANYPILSRIIEWRYFRGDEVYYVPTNRSIEINQTVDDHDNVVLPSEVVDHFIRESKYHWIMNRCICRDGSDCKDYPKDLGCIFLGEAATKMGHEIGRLVDVNEALEHAQRCRELGLIHLIGRNRLDTVAWEAGPYGKLLTICNCCPCCCLWRVLPSIPDRMSSKITGMPGISVTVTDNCIGCGTCTEDVCFVNAISLENDHAVISIDCRKCGRCISVCPENAIQLEIENNEFIHHTIRQISTLVDLT
jgi:ferredoxin